MTDLAIEIADSQSYLALDHARVRKAASWILDDAGIQRASLSIAIVDNESIQQLNRRFLDHDFPTDVLSFLLEKDDDRLEGDIVVSAEMAVAQAGVFGWQPADELLLYLVHGMLHLVGYNDQKLRDREEMREKEYEVLASLGMDPTPYVASRVSSSALDLDR